MSSPEKEAPRAHILVVEDSSVFREMQSLLLGGAGYEVSAHEGPQTALAIAAQQTFDLVVIDYELPQMNGQQFMHELRKIQPDIAVIFVSGSLTLDLAIQLSSEGVAGIFNKPANPKTLLEKVNETLARNSARDTAARVGSNSPLSGRAPSSAATYASATAAEPAADQLAFAPQFLPGTSAIFREFSHRIWKVRDFRSVLLLQGEPGSPFELLARELAAISVFREGPIMVCGATAFDSQRLIEVLAPSLLSHDAGTLIVAGVEDFTSEQQAMLNNLISGRDIFLPFARRFRLVLAATGRLAHRVDDGTFDETLYYKISSLSLSVPSLREMGDDIVAIARHFVASQDKDGQSEAGLEITPEAAEWLIAQPWPQNYDQLVSTLQAARARATAGEITPEALIAATPTQASPHRKNSALPGLPQGGDASRSTDTIRPPFPMVSDLAAPAAEPAADPASAPRRRPPAASSPAAAAVARAPAGRLFSRPAAAPARPLSAKSLFRPASASYQYTQRLEASLALADSATH